ncbi:hypothetical protein [Vibrio cholerae]|uniref:hypothetical protein n=1 Tax=Vibrio cholerae TaxID=666 RepID=UPI000E0A9875|nr:hypothetical protein [Vibrio cholerae]EJN2401288.1 hypothetical protein [Vibrio cholerae]EKF9262676.1 hypothetical protein [Vibrio cholerae]EKF9918434.1 hypothetical protein [Vibrio cholerae]EKF9925722.1 hypothetical protein [Vibrio cholerae]EKG0031798.1 hypothetical protein [Vibrio cholerae]
MAKLNKVMLIVANELDENKRMCEAVQLNVIDDAIVQLVNERKRLQDDCHFSQISLCGKQPTTV